MGLKITFSSQPTEEIARLNIMNKDKHKNKKKKKQLWVNLAAYTQVVHRRKNIHFQITHSVTLAPMVWFHPKHGFQRLHSERQGRAGCRRDRGVLKALNRTWTNVIELHLQNTFKCAESQWDQSRNIGTARGMQAEGNCFCHNRHLSEASSVARPCIGGNVRRRLFGAARVFTSSPSDRRVL